MTPRNSDCELQSTDLLFEQYERLHGMLKEPTAFIKAAFSTEDEVWVDRCASIIRDRKAKRKDDEGDS